MTRDRKMLEMIDQITDKAGERLSEHATRRLADLHHILIAGASLTTVEREEVFELWNRYVKAEQACHLVFAPEEVGL